LSNSSAPDLAPLSTFRKVAETKSFTAAARALRMTVPAVSRQISKLEKALRVQLIARTTRALRLTEAGELLYGHCERGLGELEQALAMVSSLRGEAQGLLRVVATPCFGRLHVVPAVADFLAAHPRVAVQISLSHADSSFLGSRAMPAPLITAWCSASMVSARKLPRTWTRWRWRPRATGQESRGSGWVMTKQLWRLRSSGWRGAPCCWM